MRSSIQSRVEEILETAASKGQIDVVQELALPLASHTASELVGFHPAFGTHSSPR